MSPRTFRPRFSLALLLSLVITSGIGLGLRQGIYAPIARRADLRRTLEQNGLAVRSQTPPPSWRNWLFASDDLQEVIAVEAVAGELPPGTLENLGRLPSLTTVKLRGCDVTDAEMKFLAKVKNLSTLDLANTRVSDAGLEKLVGLPLTNLDLMGTRVTADGLPTIGKMTSLGRLILPARIDGNSLTPLESLTRLTTLARSIEQRPGSIRTRGFTDDDFPTELNALPLAQVGGAINPFRPSYPTSRSAGYASQPALPEEPWPLKSPADGGTRIDWIGETESLLPDWDELARRQQLRRVQISARLGDEDFERLLALPRIEGLELELGTLDRSHLYRLLSKPGLQTLIVSCESLDMGGDDFIDVMSQRYGIETITIFGPWDFAILPGVDRIAQSSDAFNMTLVGGYPGSVATPRGGGKPAWTGPPPPRGLISINAADEPIPNWTTRAMAERGEWITLALDSLPDHDPLPDVLKWLKNPRVVSFSWSPFVKLDARLIEALVANERLLAIGLMGHFDDDVVAKLIAKPELRWLTVASPELTPALLPLVEQADHITQFELGSAQLTRELLDRYQRPPGFGGRLPSPSIPPEQKQLISLSTLGANPGRLTVRATPPERRDMSIEVQYVRDIDPAVTAGLVRLWPAATSARLPVSDAIKPWDLMRALPGLRHVQLRSYRDDLTERPSSWLADMPGLERLETLSLSVSSVSVEPDDLAWIERAPKLRTLVLESQPITSAGLVRLAACPNLEQVWMGGFVGDDGGGPMNTAFLRNGARWRNLIAPDLRLSNDDLAFLAGQSTLEWLVIDGLLINDNSLPTIETLLARGANLRLCRANLDFETVARLRASATSHGGSFDVITNYQDCPPELLTKGIL